MNSDQVTDRERQCAIPYPLCPVLRRVAPFDARAQDELYEFVTAEWTEEKEQQQKDPIPPGYDREKDPFPEPIQQLLDSLVDSFKLTVAGAKQTGSSYGAAFHRRDGATTAAISLASHISSLGYPVVFATEHQYDRLQNILGPSFNLKKQPFAFEKLVPFRDNRYEAEVFGVVCSVHPKPPVLICDLASPIPVAAVAEGQEGISFEKAEKAEVLMKITFSLAPAARARV